MWEHTHWLVLTNCEGMQIYIITYGFWDKGCMEYNHGYVVIVKWNFDVDHSCLLLFVSYQQVSPRRDTLILLGGFVGSHPNIWNSLLSYANFSLELSSKFFIVDFLGFYASISM